MEKISSPTTGQWSKIAEKIKHNVAVITENQILVKCDSVGKLNEHRWAGLSSPSLYPAPADQFSSWPVAEPGMETSDTNPHMLSNCWLTVVQI